MPNMGLDRKCESGCNGSFGPPPRMFQRNIYAKYPKQYVYANDVHVKTRLPD